jgi:hypothetical protein
MLADYRFVLGKINTECLIVSDVTLNPLDVGAELLQHVVRLGCCSAKLLSLKGADLWNISLNYKFSQCHGVLPVSIDDSQKCVNREYGSTEPFLILRTM